MTVTARRGPRRHRRRGVGSAAVACALLATPVASGCALLERAGQAAPAPTVSASEQAPPPPAGAPDLADVDLALERVATLVQPVAMAVRPGDDAIYVAERVGTVRVVRGGRVDPEPYLDLTEQTTTDGERGLLGITFSPDGSRFYASYTGPNGGSRLDEHTVDGQSLVPDSRRRLLAFDQPFSNHNGGHVAFGHDGYLYVGYGDGGGSDDPNGRAAALDTLLGKLLRIAPDVRQGDLPYGIPGDNPYAGEDGRRGEIWATGLRNPWRFSFDLATGDLWIGDVGQDQAEEVNFMPLTEGNGVDYGWSRFEGREPLPSGAAAAPPGRVIEPIATYSHDQGRCAVTGGYVYRGREIPALQGAYLFGDLCEGRVQALVQEGGREVARADLGLRVARLVSFGQDAAGELYVLSLDGGLLRIVPAEEYPRTSPRISRGAGRARRRSPPGRRPGP